CASGAPRDGHGSRARSPPPAPGPLRRRSAATGRAAGEGRSLARSVLVPPVDVGGHMTAVKRTPRAAAPNLFHRRPRLPSRHPVNREFSDEAPLGAHIADDVTSFLGSWRFIVIQTVIVMV